MGLATSAQDPMISGGGANTVGSDIALGWVDSSAVPTAVVQDYHAFTDKNNGPQLDTLTGGANDVTVVAGEHSSADGITTLEFSRKLDTGDAAADVVVDTSGAEMHVLWAYNPAAGAVTGDGSAGGNKENGGDITKHLTVTRGMSMVDFSSASVCEEDGVPTCPDDTTVPYSELAAKCYSNGWPPAKDAKTADGEDACFQSPDGKWSAKWTPSDDGESLAFTVTAQTRGWAAIGFSANNQMPESDIVLAYALPGGAAAYDASVTDRWASKRSQPAVDDAQDITETSVEVSSDGTMTFQFTRKVTTADTAHDVDLSDAVHVLYAYGDDDSVRDGGATLSEHVAKGASAAKVDLVRECGSIETGALVSGALIAHGALMAFAWLGCLLGGIGAARFRGVLGLRAGDRWFKYHRRLQITGAVLVLVAFVVVVADRKGLTKGTHQTVGLLAVVITVLQPFVARFRPHEKGTPKRARWLLIHRGLGLTGLALALAAVPLGLGKLLGGGSVRRVRPKTSVWVYVAGLLFLAAAWVWLEVERRRRARRSHASTDDGQLLDVAAGAERPKSVELTVMDDEARGDDGGGGASGGAASAAAGAARARGPTYGLALAVFFLGVVLPVLVIVHGLKARQPSVPSPESLDLCMHMPEWQAHDSETDYRCYGFAFPTDKTFHGVEFTALVDDAEIVHHMILYASTSDFRSRGFFECETMPKGSVPVYAWAPGNDKFEVPAVAGFRLGGPPGKGTSGPAYAVLQMHYNNPNRASGKVDSSGVLPVDKLRRVCIIDAGVCVQILIFTARICCLRIKMTSKLRDVDAGFWPVGIKTTKIRVPAAHEAYGLEGTYTFPAGTDVTFFSSALHEHLIGRRIWTALYPKSGTGRQYDSKGVDVLGHNDAWDFNYQAFVPTSASVKGGDVIKTTCIWTNTLAMGEQYGNTDAAAGKEVRGCEATVCEMCINFLAYYPVSKGKNKRSGYDATPQVVCNTPATCDALN